MTSSGWTERPGQLETFPCCGLTRTPAAEDALRTILESAGEGARVRTSLLAEELHVAAPTISAMLKRLRAHGLVDGRARGQIGLTPHGRRHAEELVRRHRLVETLLVRALGVPWDEAEAEAHRLEHAVSDRLLDRIDAVLHHPNADPHGDPIPGTAGEHVETWGTCLGDVAPGAHLVVERVRRHDRAALRYLDRLGMRPGARVELVSRDPWGGPIWVRVGHESHPLGSSLVRLVYGRVLPASDPGQPPPPLGPNEMP